MMNINHKHTFDLGRFDRYYVGLDRVIDQFNELAVQAASAITCNYPPYNLTKVDDSRYAIIMAVAGFDKEDIEIEQTGKKLTVSGMQKSNKTDEVFLYKGLSERNFTRSFTLADYVEVNSVELKNGILRINLELVIPDSDKPRKIEINEPKAPEINSK